VLLLVSCFAEEKAREAAQDRDRAIQAEINALQAQKSAVRAQANAVEALKQAQQSKKQVEAQKQMALGGRLAARAEASFQRSEQPLSTLLAIAAISQLEPLKASTAEANKVLNDFLALPLAQRRTLDAGVIHQTVSADGKYLASIQANGTVQVWDMETEQTIAMTQAGDTSGNQVKEAAADNLTSGLLIWSPDSQYVAIRTATKTIFWDWKNNRQTRLLPGYTLFSDGFSPVFSPDSQYALVQAFDTAQASEFPVGALWAIKAEKLLPLPAGYRLSTHETIPSLNASLFSPDGRYIVLYDNEQASPWDSKRYLWDLQAVAAQTVISFPDEYPYMLGFSADSQYTILSSDSQMYLWDFQANTVISLPAGYIYLDGLSPDSQYAVITSDSQTSLWYLGETETAEVIPILQEPLLGPATFSQDGRYVALPVVDRTVVRDIPNEAIVAQLPTAHELPTYSFSSDNQYLATFGGYYDGSKANIAQIWRIDSGQEVGHIIDANAVGFAYFSSDSKHLITEDGLAELWSTQINQDLRQVLRNVNPSKIGLSPNWQFLLIPDENNTWTVWDIEADQEIATRTFASDFMGFSADNSNRFSPDGQYAVVRSADQKVRALWDLKADNLLDLPAGYLDLGSFSPEGQYAVIYTADNKPALWDLTAKELVDLPPGYLHLGHFTPQDQYAVIYGDDDKPALCGVTPRASQLCN
jgi:WD40 repeat protein